jgi:two-component system NtrC family sensor kinase
MSSKGIKSHITAILASLLTIGMLLICMVVSIFWQRSLMRTEMEKAASILSTVAHLASDAPDENIFFSPAVLTRLQNDLGASCVMLSINNIVIRLPEKCGAEDSALQERLQAVIATGASSTKTIDAAPTLPFLGHKLLVTAVPIAQHQGVRSSMGAVISLQSVYEQVSQGRQIAYIYILVNVLILTTIGLFRLIHVVVRPIEHLVRLTNTYQKDEGNPFFSDQESNEFGQLSIALNRMLHRINDDRQKLRVTVGSLEKANQELRDTQQKMVQTEKMAAIGRLAAGLAHEIGNPIGIVQGYLELLGQSGLSNEEQKQFSSRSLQELERINRLIHQLLNFARTRTDDSGSTEIHPLLLELVDMVQAQKKLAGLEFQLQLDAECDRIAAGAESVHQVFLNCLLNAIDAVKECHETHKGTICLSTINTTSDEGRPFIQIAIQDNGIGIKETDRDSLFDPFFTTKEPGKGTGLGLSVSYALVEGLGGQMQIKGKEDRGATVFILLPLWANRRTT